MKVVVTGGSGQLGSVVLSRLIADRRVKQLVCVDVQRPTVVSGKLRFEHHDITRGAMEPLMAGADALIHLAFKVVDAAPPDEMYAVNVEGSRRVFDAAARAGVRTILYSSSNAAYGVVPGQPQPLVESSPRQRSPKLVYADNKFEVEAYLDEFERTYPAIRVVRFRPGILLGRRMNHAFGRMLRQRLFVALSDVPLPLVWDEDVADAVWLALFGDQRGAFNLTSEQPLSPAELALAGGLRLIRCPSGTTASLARFADTLRGAGLRAPIDAGWLLSTDVPLVASSERARHELGWRPSCATQREVIQRFVREVPLRLDPRILLFMLFVEQAGRRVAAGDLPREAAGSDSIIHLEITGPRGGDFELRFRSGAISVRRGVPRPPSSVVSLSDSVFLDVLAGTIDLTRAQLTGKVTLSGDPAGGWVLAGIVSAFRSATEARGTRGLVARGMTELFRLGRVGVGGERS